MMAAGALVSVMVFASFRYFKGSGKSKASVTTTKEVKKEEPSKVEPGLTMEDLLKREGLFTIKKTENKYCLHPEYLIELLNFIGVIA